jgi:hypothetical protein
MSSEISEILEEVEGWMDYIDTTLANQNEVENINLGNSNS